MLVRNTKLLAQMTLYEAKRFTMFPTEIAGSIIARLLEVTLYATFWLLVGKYAGSGDLDPKQLISYYLIINGITAFFFTQLGIGSLIIKMIKFGELNQVLIRPISPLLVPWSQRAGRNLLNVFLGGIQVVIGFLLINTDGISFSLLFPVVLLNTILLNLAFNFITGTVGFYVIEAGGFKNTFLHIYALCGGLLMPLFLMPTWVSNMLQLTPFPAAQYHLTILLQGVYQPSPGYVLIGSLWAGILMAFAIWFWRRSLARYEAVGI